MTSQQISPMCEDITGFSLSGCQTIKFGSCHHCDCYSLRSTLKCPYSLKSWCQVLCKCVERVVPPQKTYSARSQFSKTHFAVCSHTLVFMVGRRPLGWELQPHLKVNGKFWCFAEPKFTARQEKGTRGNVRSHVANLKAACILCLANMELESTLCDIFQLDAFMVCRNGFGVRIWGIVEI